MNKKNMTRQNGLKKLVLSRETLIQLNVRGSYCSNSTLSAEVSLCVSPNGAPVRLPECATPQF